MTPHVHQGRPGQDTGRESVKSPNSNDSALIVAVEGMTNAYSDSHADGCDQREDCAHDELYFCGHHVEFGNTSSESKALEGLVEYYYDE